MIFNLQQSGDYNLSAAMSAVLVALILLGYITTEILRKINIEKLKNFSFRQETQPEIVNKPC